MLYKLLAQTHPDYDPALIQELEDLYAGGYEILKRAEQYLPQDPGETDGSYRQRLKTTAYIAYLKQIVNDFTADLFARDVTVAAAKEGDPEETTEAPDPYYAEFADDADMRGTGFSKLLAGACRTAMVQGKAYVALDFPALDEKPETRAEEDATGSARAYAFEVPVSQVIDWQEDDRGGFRWVIIHREERVRQSPAEIRGGVVEEFKVWQLTEDGTAEWALYRTEPRKGDEPHKPDSEVQLVGQGKTSFPMIPVLKLDLDRDLWIGGCVGPAAKEHFQRRSSLVSAEAKSLFAVPVAKLAPEIGAGWGEMPSEAGSNPHRGNDPIAQFRAKGYLVMGDKDALEFAEPAGSCYELVDQQLDRLKDEIFRVVHQMAAAVSNSSTSLGRSGESKREDRHPKEIVLSAYGSELREFALRVYYAISEARGEDVQWNVHGLEGFEEYDRVATLEEALQVSAVAIPSQTWRQHYLTDLAFRLAPNLDPATQGIVRKEIAEGVVAEAELKDAMQEAMLMAPAAGEDDDEDEDGSSTPEPSKGPPRPGVKPPASKSFRA